MINQVKLTPRNSVFPVARILNSKVLESYQEAIKSYGEKARESLDIFRDINGYLAGSNCFAPIVLRNLLPKNSRLATMADLGLATEINPDFLRGFYSDTGLTLRTERDSYKPYNFLANDLAKQLKKRGMPLKEGMPKVIYFDALDLRENTDSHCGLVYELNEKAKLGENIIDAPELTRNFRFKTIDERGIPIEDNDGSRILYAGDGGVSRFYLGRSSDLDSGSRGLADSGGDGRVVVVGVPEESK